ncbi:alpha/beta hydrolase [Clostridium sporogenes]|uniref:Alpha/beta hydrolase n=1 Tax=Clostridium botulinum TaxID=1491 RepID=A0A6M0SY86_CLOBO|nr:alpha/beta hydrolase [Clostridium sporogenes]NFA60469.1 alpha/beta hydrolase [Clostridium botulinum]NFI72288.1 alpha/beta hydrolase [Clostridium sporogenes]NFL72598.1 alpha/beta hydrolase [Clostridium sporogenes]NFM24551.1 alpha/beta hydrolase [Clostridium sporogenes]NFP60864.1 alpha/beta hydrolase [Clostridium sporogenes]
MECKIKNISINYEIIGNGKPIIMLHGYSVDHRLMLGCMEPIFTDTSKYKRIYIDLPGMGKSESAEWINSSDTMLDIIIEFIKRIIPNENFLLAGESYGGYLSRGIIYKMPNMVDGVLLICPVIIADNKKRTLPDHVVLVKDNNLLSKLSLEEVNNFNSMSVVQTEKIYKKYKNYIMSGVKVANNNFLNSIMKNGYEFSFNVDNINKKFDKPTLILLGKQDSSVGYKDAWNILNNFPRATFAVLDRAGHNLQIEQEELFNSLVNDWIVRINA